MKRRPLAVPAKRLAPASDCLWTPVKIQALKEERLPGSSWPHWKVFLKGLAEEFSEINLTFIINTSDNLKELFGLCGCTVDDLKPDVANQDIADKELLAQVRKRPDKTNVWDVIDIKARGDENEQ